MPRAVCEITIVIMINLNSVTPKVPIESGELAWVVQRIEQIERVLAPLHIASLRIWATPRTTDRLVRQYKEDRNLRSSYPEIEIVFVPFTAISPDEISWYDDRTLEFDIITDSNELLNCYAYAYPSPISTQYIETRWVLQVIDGMPAMEAEEAAARLL
jgi:hypothetical protein